MSGGKVRAKLSALLELANAGPLFQGVQCHAVFMELQHVSHERFEDTIDSLRACSPEASSAYHCDMKRLYYRLLDGGFLDNYLHLHYDVNLHTSYATVVSIAKYAFDMSLLRAGVSQKALVCKQYLSRASRVSWLRQMCLCDETVAIEDARYLCFSSVLNEMVLHVQKHLTNLRQARGF